MAENPSASPETIEEELCARFERTVPDRVNSDRHLVWRGRNLTADCLVQIGSVRFLLRIEEGTIRECRRGFVPLSSWAFAVRGSARGWAALWQDPPPPGWHDIFALVKRGEMSIEGNIHLFMANLQYFKDILSLAREGGGR
jgi:hypothetical protein